MPYTHSLRFPNFLYHVFSILLTFDRAPTNLCTVTMVCMEDKVVPL